MVPNPSLFNALFQKKFELFSVGSPVAPAKKIEPVVPVCERDDKSTVVPSFVRESMLVPELNDKS